MAVYLSDRHFLPNLAIPFLSSRAARHVFACAKIMHKV